MLRAESGGTSFRFGVDDRLRDAGISIAFLYEYW
jgi:hypothetical protein